LMSERSAIKLVFATMTRAAERWCRVSITDIERHQLQLLRAELGLDPPPGRRSANATNEKNQARRGMKHGPDLQDAHDLTPLIATSGRGWGADVDNHESLGTNPRVRGSSARGGTEPPLPAA